MPVFTTGCGTECPHRTTKRLLTIAAFRSSSRAMMFLWASISRACSTIPTAPSTIRARAAMTAELMHEALEGTRGDREQALVSFVGEASAEDLAALRRALDDLS